MFEFNKKKIIKKDKIYFTPDVFVAGVLDYKKGDIWEIAWNNAAHALDDEDILLNVSQQHDKLYYIAAHSKDFTSITEGNLDAVSPLSSALPGNPDHRGDGIYIFEILSGFAIIVCQNEQLFSYLAKDAQLKDIFNLYPDLPQYENNYGSDVWIGYNRHTLKQAAVVTLYSYLLLAVLITVAGFANIYLITESHHYDESQQKMKQEFEQKINTFKSQVNNEYNNQQTILKEFELLDKITKSAFEYKATVKKYSYSKKDNKFVYEIEYPYYVTSNVFSFLPNSKVNFDENRNVIVVKSE